MREIDAGHIYRLDSIDGRTDNSLIYVKRVGPGYPGNGDISFPGTLIQEVCRAQIARLKYVRYQSVILDDRASIYEDNVAIEAERQVIRTLERRAARRHGWPTPRFDNIPDGEIELLLPCEICGHLFPEHHHHGKL